MSLLFRNEPRGSHPPSWYAATAETGAERAPLKGAQRADVCVIGAGFTGLSAALHLAEAGLDVVVLDAHRAGFGASGRNGGQVGSGLNWDQRKLEKTEGPEAARRFWDLAEEAKALTRDLVARHAPEAGYRPGVAHADFTAADARDRHDEAAHLSKTYGYDVEVLDKPAIRDVIGTEAYQGGWIDWGAGHLHPLRYALGLARAAGAAGARIFERSWVTQITPGAPARVQTESGHVTADHVVLATNGYTQGLNRHIAARVMPINNYMVATDPLPDPAAVLAKDIAVADNRFVLNYYRLSEDNRLLFGGGESYGDGFPADIAAKVRKPLEEIFPQLTGIGISHAWGGTLGITMMRLPAFARPGAGIWAAAGFSGHGVALGTMAGRVMAEAIAGEASRFELMSTLRVPPFPGGQLARKPLLTLAMTWYAMRDRLGI